MTANIGASTCRTPFLPATAARALEALGERITINRLTNEIRLLIAGQDGSEINSTNLKERIELAKKIEEAAGCYEQMRDTAASNYMCETGRFRVPATGNRNSLGVTSAIVDGKASLAPAASGSATSRRCTVRRWCSPAGG